MRIPVRAPLRSLNVGVAAAMALAEALRQLRCINACQAGNAEHGCDGRVTFGSNSAMFPCKRPWEEPVEEECA